MRSYRLFALTAALTLTATGCHSAFIEATLSNRTTAPLSLVEVDYPSASFGTQTLAPGQDFHYRFKVLGSGPSTITWTDAEHREHTYAGPSLRENQEGTFNVTFAAAGATWVAHLNSR